MYTIYLLSDFPCQFQRSEVKYSLSSFTPPIANLFSEGLLDLINAMRNIVAVLKLILARLQSKSPAKYSRRWNFLAASTLGSQFSERSSGDDHPQKETF